VKFGQVVLETCERMARQTDRHTDTLIAILRNKVKIRVALVNLSGCHITNMMQSEMTNFIPGAATYSS